jgi:8-oxo-dGTP diphosphatase
MKITVDGVLFTYNDNKLKVLLIKRAIEPYIGQYALPGGFILPDETTEQAI